MTIHNPVHCMDKSNSLHLICGKPDLGLKSSLSIYKSLKDIYQGFSGGPLVCEKDGKTVLHGIVHWRRSIYPRKCPIDEIGLYVNVYQHLEFIKENSLVRWKIFYYSI